MQVIEHGMSGKSVRGKHNVSQQSFFRWKAKYAGMGVSKVKRLRALARENAHLNQIAALQALDIRILKRRHSKKFCAF